MPSAEVGNSEPAVFDDGVMASLMSGGTISSPKITTGSILIPLCSCSQIPTISLSRVDGLFHSVPNSFRFPALGKVFIHNFHLPLRVVFDEWYAATAWS